MATGLAARMDAAGDPLFQKRVGEAMAEAAVAIAAESPATAGHISRAIYAAMVLNDPPEGIVWVDGHAPFTSASSRRVAAFTLALVTQGIDAGSTDTQIGNGVAAVWNALAGA